MRRARINLKGGFYHVMSRGYEGKYIFQSDFRKKKFLEYLEQFSSRNKIKLLAWCVLNNHYHLVLINESGKLSKFMKELNGTYGIWFRKLNGGRGQVFDGRFKSALIENEDYLFSSIMYLYKNPVRAGIVNCSEDYMWSSIREILDKKNKINKMTDVEYLNENIFEVENIYEILNDTVDSKCTPFNDRWGETFGTHAFRFRSLKKSNRRKSENKTNKLRIKEKKILSPVKLIANFLKVNKYSNEELLELSRKGSRIRGKLLVMLRDEFSMQLNEIHKLYPFINYSYSSLGKIYQYAKEKDKK